MMYDAERARQPTTESPAFAERWAKRAQREPLLTQAERDEVAGALQQTTLTATRNPRQAVEDAEGAFDAATAHIVAALAERREVLRAGWHSADPAAAQDPDPEAQAAALRVALSQYREITERLLRF